MEEPVTSPRNERLKKVRAVRAGKDREHIVLEGPHLVEEALATKQQLLWLLFDPDLCATKGFLATARDTGIACIPCEASLLKQVSDLDSPPGCLGLARRPSSQGLPNLKNLVTNQQILLVAAGVQDPGNLGALVRVAAGLGAAGVLRLKGGVSLFHPRAIRGSSGTVFRLPVWDDVSQDAFLSVAETSGMPLWATTTSGSSLREITRPPSCALLFGEEGQGLNDELEKRCVGSIGIPLQRGVESLNVATAAAICLFHWQRQDG